MTEVKQFDPRLFKEQERTGFDYVAERYEWYIAQGAEHPVADAVIAYARLTPGLIVLDVATGPGTLARKIAPQLGPEGHVKGVDISEAMVAVARRKAQEEGLTNISFEVLDAENMPLGDNLFDRVVCSLGLMHFPSAEKAVGEMYRVLKPGGRLAAGVWGELGQIPYLEVGYNTVLRVFGTPKVSRPPVWRFGKAEVLADLIAGAGFGEIETKPVRGEMVLPDAASYWKFFLNSSGMVSVIVEKQPPEVQQKLLEVCAAEIEQYREGEVYRLDSQLMLVTAVKQHS